MEFMVDTGADTTVLSRSDAESLGVDFAGLEDPYDVGGIARRCQASVIWRSRVKKARLRGVLIAQFTGTFW